MENQSYVESVKRASIVQSFFAQVYGWMFFGLLSTGIVAYYTAHSPALLNLIFGSQITFYAFLFAPIVLVMIISSKINSLSASMASFLFFVYSDLSKMGSILFMLLIGLIIASVVNMFLKNDTMMWILTYVGIVIFVGLTAYDMQKLKKIAHSIDDDESSIAKFAVLGALTLYLDFINLFLRLLQIFGKKR